MVVCIFGRRVVSVSMCGIRPLLRGFIDIVSGMRTPICRVARPCKGGRPSSRVEELIRCGRYLMGRGLDFCVAETC